MYKTRFDGDTALLEREAVDIRHAPKGRKISGEELAKEIGSYLSKADIRPMEYVAEEGE